ncbi:hypothetical protein, partial [Microcoleus sp. D3_18a_C4]|uniref:hypothetical protein n=1 Tax=Microcoleus sp. D3_18a_C4 TaxID=3055332 RepID=UPI002FCE96E8
PARPKRTGGTPIPQTCGSYLILIPYPILSPLGVDESLFAVSTGEGARIWEHTHKKSRGAIDRISTIILNKVHRVHPTN